MRQIVYYVATSLDGFISGPDGDISGFVQGGSAVEKYREDLKAFDTVIMGRKTYEFGYKFGLVPGQPAYPHMEHYIFSRSLKFERQNSSVHVESLSLDFIRQLKAKKGTQIYLCGGGDLAGWLLDNELIEILKIKLNPLILGKGVRLFGSSTNQCHLSLVEHQKFDDGMQIHTYKINHP